MLDGGAVDDGFIGLADLLALVSEGILLGVKDHQVLIISILFEEIAFTGVRQLLQSLPLQRYFLFDLLERG